MPTSRSPAAAENACYGETGAQDLNLVDRASGQVLDVSGTPRAKHRHCYRAMAIVPVP